MIYPWYICLGCSELPQVDFMFASLMKRKVLSKGKEKKKHKPTQTQAGLSSGNWNSLQLINRQSYSTLKSNPDV